MLNKIIKNTHFDICLYHNYCNDGVTSFWCIKKYGQNFNIIGIPVYHNNAIDVAIFSDKNVILLDVCLNNDKIRQLINICKYVMIINYQIKDDACPQLNDIRTTKPFDLMYTKNSICQTMWNILNPDEQEPKFITYIGRQSINLDWGDESHWFVIGWRKKFIDLTYDSVEILFLNQNDLIDIIILHGKHELHTNFEKYKTLSQNIKLTKFLYKKKKYNIVIHTVSDINMNEFGEYLCRNNNKIDFTVIYTENYAKGTAILKTIKEDIVSLLNKSGIEIIDIINNTISKKKIYYNCIKVGILLGLAVIIKIGVSKIKFINRSCYK